MKKKKFEYLKYSVIIVLFFFFFLSNIYSQNQTKKLLDKIIVAIDHNYPPYIFRGEDGILKGYLVDLWQEWEKVTEVKVVLYAVEWAQALKAIQEGKADIIDTIFFTEERSKIFTFSQPYVNINVPIFYSKSISGLADYDSLKGFMIAVKEGDAAIDYLLKNGVTNLVLFKDYKDIAIAAKEDKIKIFTIDEPCAIYYLNKYGILENFKHGFNLYTGQFHRAVRKGNEPILEYVEKGFNSIPKSVYKELQNKWFGVQLKNQIPVKTLVLALSIIILIIIFFISNSILLTKMVKTRTKELETANLEIEKEKNFLENLFKIFPDIVLTFDNLLNEKTSYFPKEYDSNKEVLKKHFLTRLKDEFFSSENKSISNYAASQYEINIDDKNFCFDIRIIDSKNDLYLFLARDITEKKNIEKNIFEKQKLEVIGTLSSGLAHDVNNILHSTLSISSLINMMIEENDISIDNLKEYSQILEKSALKGTSIVSSLLNFSKDSVGQKSLFNLRKTLDNSIEIFNLKFKKKVTINLSTEIDEAYIFGNENQIMQAILNILINAFEAIEKKGQFEKSYINVSFNLIDKMYAINIEDNGVGIDDSIADKIFDPFFTTKGQGKGAGIGLTIARKIIDEHGGEIKFKSFKNSHTIFTILLPLSQNTVLEVNEEPVYHDLNNIKILLVDDDNGVLMVTKRNLEKKGFNVLATDDVDEAKKLFFENEKDISLCILDLVMPKLSGLELLEFFISKGYKGKSIICTGYKDDPRLKEPYIKIDEIIEKPFQINQIIESIVKLLKKENI